MLKIKNQNERKRNEISKLHFGKMETEYILEEKLNNIAAGRIVGVYSIVLL